MVVAVLGGTIFVKHKSCQKNTVLFYPLCMVTAKNINLIMFLLKILL